MEVISVSSKKGKETASPQNPSEVTELQENRKTGKHQNTNLVIKFLVAIAMIMLYQLTNMIVIKNGLNLSNQR